MTCLISITSQHIPFHKITSIFQALAGITPRDQTNSHANRISSAKNHRLRVRASAGSQPSRGERKHPSQTFAQRIRLRHIARSLRRKNTIHRSPTATRGLQQSAHIWLPPAHANFRAQAAPNNKWPVSIATCSRAWVYVYVCIYRYDARIDD